MRALQRKNKMARRRAGVGRTSADEHCLRRLFLLKLILGGKDATVDAIIKELKQCKCRSFSLNHIASDTALLSKAGWLVHLGSKASDDGRLVPAVLSEGATFAFLWKNSEAAERLDKQVNTKSLLAKAIVDDIQEMKNVKWAILGSGTSVHAVARELFERCKIVGIEGISTSNIFVLQEYIRQKPLMTIEVTAGTLDWATACLLLPHGGTYQEGRAAEIVITGFSGLTKEGFHTRPLIDVGEKERQLGPNGTSCRYILIPLEWHKIGAYHRLVKFPTDLNNRPYTYTLYTVGFSQNLWYLTLYFQGLKN
jgi:hypothetical protein